MVKKKLWIILFKHVFDYSCNSFSLKVDEFASCEQGKRNVLMKQKQLIFQMMEYNLKTKVSDTIWFAKSDLRLADVTLSSGC